LSEKPIALAIGSSLEKLIQKHSNVGDTVLDCFSGSGSTAVSCIKLDRNFLGCEISPEFYQKSMERIENAKKLKKSCI